ncbi:hypothetical protein RhiirC2_792417 [Rhizophagus irregularis]|uniref:Uncharacterized protein n=1 Tax=Rhizophagus irregularis TaxID=588596 RepID=A0A2N1MHC7_9GLOM|nr:hypothetical protein RhiirC2_792417 [Rhizophagus irregularis]
MFSFLFALVLKKNPSFPETVSDWAEREMIRRHVNYKRSTLNLSDKTQKISKSRKPNGNSKRFKKRKLIESNNEINEEGQQASGPTLSTKNCAVDRVIQQKSEEERETDQEVSQVKDYGNKHKATHNNSTMKNEKKLLK